MIVNGWSQQYEGSSLTSAVATILVHGPPNTPNCRKCGGIVWPHERHRPEGKVSGDVGLADGVGVNTSA